MSDKIYKDALFLEEEEISARLKGAKCGLCVHFDRNEETLYVQCVQKIPGFLVGKQTPACRQFYPRMKP